MRVRAAVPVTAQPQRGTARGVAPATRSRRAPPRQPVIRCLDRKSRKRMGRVQEHSMQRNELCRARPAARAVAGRDRGRLHHAHADPGAGDSRHPRRQATSWAAPRPAPARPPASRCRSCRSWRRIANTSPSPARHPVRALILTPDARARDPGRGIVPDLRQVHEPALDRRLRRRRHQAAAADRARRRRDPRRHARPAARPHRAEERLPRAGRDLRARRGRPHARHGLHPRHQADHGAAAG